MEFYSSHQEKKEIHWKPARPLYGRPWPAPPSFGWVDRSILNLHFSNVSVSGPSRLNFLASKASEFEMLIGIHVELK